MRLHFRSIWLDAKRVLRNPLYRNSIFLISTRIFGAATGFFFWMIAARLYNIQDVGLSTALISSIGLVSIFAMFGFDYSLIRFLPHGDRSIIFSTCLTTTILSSLVAGIIFVIGVRFFSPDLTFLQQPLYLIIFILFGIMNTIALITGNTFIGMRRSDHYFIQNILLGLRILLLLPLVFLGRLGIFAALGLSFVITTLYSIYRLRPFLNVGLQVNWNFIRESFHFSSRNYIGDLFSLAPSLILPIMILSIRGGADAARFYIAYALGNLVLMIPDGISTSLFVEGSHGESLKKNLIRAGVTIYSCLVPAVLLFFLLGNTLLGMFGHSYTTALPLLKILVLSSFLASVYYLFIPVQNVRMRVNDVVAVNALRFVLVMGLSYILLIHLGIMGVGYAWIITYGVIALVISGITCLQTGFFGGGMSSLGEKVLHLPQDLLCSAGFHSACKVKPGVDQQQTDET